MWKCGKPDEGFPHLHNLLFDVREFVGERKEHRVSRYELPEKLKRKVIDRLKPYIDRFGYREAVEGKPSTAPKAKAAVSE